VKDKHFTNATINTTGQKKQTARKRNAPPLYKAKLNSHDADVVTPLCHLAGAIMEVR